MAQFRELAFDWLTLSFSFVQTLCPIPSGRERRERKRFMTTSRSLMGALLLIFPTASRQLKRTPLQLYTLRLELALHRDVNRPEDPVLGHWPCADSLCCHRTRHRHLEGCRLRLVCHSRRCSACFRQLMITPGSNTHGFDNLSRRNSALFSQRVTSSSVLLTNRSLDTLICFSSRNVVSSPLTSTTNDCADSPKPSVPTWSNSSGDLRRAVDQCDRRRRCGRCHRLHRPCHPSR